MGANPYPLARTTISGVLESEPGGATRWRLEG